MMVSHAVAQSSLRWGRWLLPWFPVLLVSIALACAATSAITRPWTTADWSVRTGSGVLADGQFQLTEAADDKAAPQACSSDSSYFGSLGWFTYDRARGAACGFVIANN